MPITTRGRAKAGDELVLESHLGAGPLVAVETCSERPLTSRGLFQNPRSKMAPQDFR